MAAAVSCVPLCSAGANEAGGAEVQTADGRNAVGLGGPTIDLSQHMARKEKELFFSV